MFGEKRQIFRQVALDRLASPDELDRLAPVTSLKGWIALLSMVLVIAAGLMWGITGSIPTRVKGKGVLLTSGGVVNVVSTGSGPVEKLHVRPDQMVAKGEIVATVSQPELQKEIEATEDRLVELVAEDRQALGFAERNLKLQHEVFSKKIENLRGTMQILGERKRWLQEKAASQEKILERGLITRQTLIETQQSLQRVESEIRDCENQEKQIAAQRIELKNRVEQESTTRQLRVSEAKRALEALEKRLSLVSNINSPCNGRVLEVMAAEGDLVRISTPIISVEPLNQGKQGLEAVIYVSLADGKLVQPEMTAQVTPGSVKREEYGFIHAKVKSVSRFPATAEGMMSILGNDQVVRSLTTEGAPIALRAELETDPKTESGFRWSSVKGPPIQVTSGTFCDVFITVREQPPISLIIPYLKKTIGVM